MFLLLVGGIETSSSKIISSIGGIGPSLWQSSVLWLAVIGALGAFALTNKISAGGFSFQGSRESVMAGFATVIYIFFMADLFSIVSKVGESTCPAGAALRACGWEYWVIWAMIIPLLVGYAISLIQFVGGSD